jgi:hypothetical protein
MCWTLSLRAITGRLENPTTVLLQRADERPVGAVVAHMTGSQAAAMTSAARRELPPQRHIARSATGLGAGISPCSSRWCAAAS